MSNNEVVPTETKLAIQSDSPLMPLMELAIKQDAGIEKLERLFALYANMNLVGFLLDFLLLIGQDIRKQHLHISCMAKMNPTTLSAFEHIEFVCVFEFFCVYGSLYHILILDNFR